MASTFDNVTITGTLTVVGETTLVGGMAADSLARADFVEDALTEYSIPLTEMRVTGTGALLGASAGTPSGAFGITAGTHGSATPIIVGETAYYNSKTNKLRFNFALPAEYVAAGDIRCRIRAKATATMSVSQTLDITCYANDEGGGVSADICATSVQTLTTSYVDYSFTITAATRAVGDILDIEITGVADDTGGTANGYISIGKISMLLDIKG